MIAPSVTIHAHALVEDGVMIGERSRIWAFAHILPGAVIGEECNICDHAFIEGGVRLGDRVTIKCGVYLWDGIEVEDDVFIGPGVALTNDKHPRSMRYPDKFLKTKLGRGCSVGANATILPGISIGSFSMIGAGSVVVKDIPPHALVAGNPASLRGWVCSCGGKLDLVAGYAECCGSQYTLIERRMLEVIDDH